MADFMIDFGDFAATTFRVTPVSEAGRVAFAARLGAGAVSADLPKSQGGAFERFLHEGGFTVKSTTPSGTLSTAYRLRSLSRGV